MSLSVSAVTASLRSLSEAPSQELTANLIQLLNQLTLADLSSPTRLENHVTELHKEIMSNYPQQEEFPATQLWRSIFQRIESKRFPKFVLDLLIRSYFNYRRDEPEYQFCKKSFYLAFLEEIVDNNFIEKLGHQKNLFFNLYKRNWVAVAKDITQDRTIQHRNELAAITAFEYEINHVGTQLSEDKAIALVLKKYFPTLSNTYLAFIKKLLVYPNDFAYLVNMGEPYLLITCPFLIAYLSIYKNVFTLSDNLHPLLYSHYARHKWGFWTEDRENPSPVANPAIEIKAPAALIPNEAVINSQAAPKTSLATASSVPPKAVVNPPSAKKPLAPTIKPKIPSIPPSPKKSSQPNKETSKSTEPKQLTDFDKGTAPFLLNPSPEKIDSLFAFIANYYNSVTQKEHSKETLHVKLLSMWDWLFCHIEKKLSIETYRDAIWQASHHLNNHLILLASFLNALALSNSAKQLFSIKGVPEELLAYIFHEKETLLLEFWKNLSEENRTFKGLECTLLFLLNNQPQRLGDLTRLEREAMLKELDPQLLLMAKRELKWLTTFTATPLIFGHLLREKKRESLFERFSWIAAYTCSFQAQFNKKRVVSLNPILAYWLLKRLDSQAKTKNDPTIDYSYSITALNNLFPLPKNDPKPILDGKPPSKRQKIDQSQ